MGGHWLQIFLNREFLAHNVQAKRAREQAWRRLASLLPLFYHKQCLRKDIKLRCASFGLPVDPCTWMHLASRSCFWRTAKTTVQRTMRCTHRLMIASQTELVCLNLICVVHVYRFTC